MRDPINKYSIQNLENIYSEFKGGLLPSRLKETALGIINESSSTKQGKVKPKKAHFNEQEDGAADINNITAKLQVFLCHSTQDKPKVKDIFSKLKAEGFDAWLDEFNLIPGEEWDLEIKKAVRNSHAVLVCLSNSSINKEGYVQKEISYALDIALEKPTGTIYIVPVRLEECKVPESLLKYQYADYFTDQGWDKLLGALRKRSKSVFG